MLVRVGVRVTRQVVLLVAVLAGHLGWSQSSGPLGVPSFELPVSAGLPDLYVKDFVQDHFGFTWIATNSSVCRFDGSSIYQIPRDSFPHEFYSRLAVDTANSSLWVGSYFGLFSVDLLTHEVTDYTWDTSGVPRLGSEYVHALLVDDRSHRLWVGTRTGLASVDLTENLVHRHAIVLDEQGQSTEHEMRVFDIVQDRSQPSRLWLATTGGLIEFDAEIGTFRRVPLQLEGHQGHLPLMDLYADEHDDLIYITVRASIGFTSPYNYLVFSPRQGTFVRGYYLDSQWQSKGIFLKNDSTLWLSAETGLAVLDRGSGTVEAVEDPAGDQPSIDFVDDARRMWCVGEHGISVYDPFSTQVESYYYTSDIPRAYHIMQDLAQHPVTEEIYVSVLGAEGIFVHDPVEHTWRTMVRSDYSIGSKNLYDGIDAHFDRAGKPLFVTNTDLFTVNANGQLRPATQLRPRGRTGSWSASVLDRRGRLWVAGANQLQEIDPQDGSFRDHSDLLLECDEQHGEEILYQDRKGNLWLGGGCNGISVRQNHTSIFLHSADFRDLDPAFPDARVLNFAERDDTLWILSEDHSICLVDLKNGNIKPCKVIRLDDLFEKNPTSMDVSEASHSWGAFDLDGYYWILTSQGLLKYDDRRRRVDLFGESDGFVIKDRELQLFVGGEILSLRDGRMLYGTRKGIHFFDPRTIRKSVAKPIPYLKSILVNNEPLETDTTSFFERQVKLSPYENYLSFEFSAIGYADPAKTRFSYKLDGVDEDWVELSGRKYVSYANLRGGHYQFNLRAGQAGGAWSEQVQRLSIRIAKYWWNTWLARILGVLLLGGIGYGLYHNSVRRAIEQKQVQIDYEKQLAEIKMNALTAQMNPHFIFNSLNSIDYYIIKNQTDRASDYLNRFSRLIRLILNNSRSTYISLRDDLEALRLYIEIESLRFADKFDYVVSAAEEIDLDNVQVPPMLFQPYVENAIWHGLMQSARKGRLKVEVRLNEDKDKIVGVIEDDGIGRQKAQELKSKGIRRNKRKSMGMNITKDKIEVINFLHDMDASVQIEDLTNGSGEAAGTRVTLEIPI